MPRDLPLGNGALQVNFDALYQLVDLYFPHVGEENHSLGHPFRLGLWSEGRFAWTDDAAWRRQLRYERDTLVSDVLLEHPGLGIRLRCADTVDFNSNVFLRHFKLSSLDGRPRAVRLFFHHDFHISGSDVGDTAYYDPSSGGLYHYKGARWFHMNVLAGQRGWTSFAVGYKEWQGQEGTWRDAEDGELSRNPIAQGSVDSVGMLALQVPARGEAACTYWLCAGTSYQEVRDLSVLVVKRTPETLITRTRDYWRAWGLKEELDSSPLPEEVGALYRRSLLVIRTQVDNEGGVVASTDSDVLKFNRDTYSYMWPRDGALVACALDKAGYGPLADQFFRFCLEHLVPSGYWMTKFTPAGAVGSTWHPWLVNGERQLPIQEDEAGLVLWALWLHYQARRDIEFIKPLYRPLIKAVADFLVEFRDSATGLPQPSYDLWEERRGVHAFTCGAVIGGLKAAAHFTRLFGENDRAQLYEDTVKTMTEATGRYLFSETRGRFLRSVSLEGGATRPDEVLDSSLAGLFAYGAFAADDPRIVATMEQVEERLWVKSEVGGLARYENDYYHRVPDDLGRVPGNPWILTTLWLAEWYVDRATSVEALGRARDLLQWAARKALPSGVLPEQLHPLDGTPVSVSPLTWSHGSFVYTTLKYLDKLHELQVCPTCGQSLYRRHESHPVTVGVEAR
jgi:GH15 family glucan-1,4-alpha-glucosidase